MVEDRIAALEARADDAGEPRARAGGQDAGRVRSPAPPPPLARAPPIRAPRRAAARARAPPRPARDIEDFLGGNVLAWLGGFAVLAGLAFLLTIAISRGWLGEGARTLLAGGALARAARRRRVAARAPRPHRGRARRGRGRHRRPVRHARRRRPGLRPGPAAGRAARRVRDRRRRRRRSRSAGARRCIGWLGLLGALHGAGRARRARRRRHRLPRDRVRGHDRRARLAALDRARRRPRSPSRRCSGSGGCCSRTLGDPATIVTLAVFGVLTAALALGFELNRPGLHPVAIGPRARLRPHPFAIVLVISAALLAITGWELLDGEPWLVALAAAHIAVGIAAAHVRRISREVALGILAIGIVLADLAFASIATRAAAGARLGAVGAPVRRAARRPHAAARAASSTASSAGPTTRARSASTGSWRSPACSGRWRSPRARRWSSTLARRRWPARPRPRRR